MNRIALMALAALGSAAVISVAIAQRGPQTPEQQAEQAVKTRQGLFEVQGFAFGPVGAMLKDAPFDAAVVQKEAARVQVTAGMIAEVFQFDTRKFQVSTKAKETIWSNKSDFDKKITDLQTAAADLAAAAAKSDRAATLKAAGAVGGACKSCHEDFRDK
jgi:cytochrome c556